MSPTVQSAFRKLLWPLLVLGVILIIFLIWLVTNTSKTPQTPTSSPPTFDAQKNDAYSPKERTDNEYIALIKKQYSYLKDEPLTIVQKELVQPHWYIITTYEGSTKMPFRYIFYDDYPNSSALVLSAIGLEHPELPQADAIPENILKQLEVKSR